MSNETETRKEEQATNSNPVEVRGFKSHPPHHVCTPELFNETKWLSKKGKVKRVGPTSASKALHLVAPDLFMLWDREIRNDFGFKDNGEEYARFLTSMQNWMKKLKPTIERLQNQYKKSCTKIIDQYNWKKCRT